MLHSWEDLLPESAATSVDPYARLSETQLRRLARFSRARWLIGTGRDSDDGASLREAAEIRRTFAEEGEDVEALLAMRQRVRDLRIQNSCNPAIVGTRVALAGLVLPLDWDGKQRFDRFLLAPDLAACSHEAPPPHNQVTYIEAPGRIDLAAFGVTEETADPCFRVEGTIRFVASSHSAFRVDGMMRVDSSYIIDVTAILPASPAEIVGFRPTPRFNVPAHQTRHRG